MKLRSRIYTGLVIALLLLGGGFDVLLLCSIVEFEPLDVFTERLDSGTDTDQLIFLLLSLIAHLALAVSVYIVSLDPFRAERPSGLVYLNFLPVSLFLGSAYFAFTSGADELIGLAQGGGALAAALALPLFVYLFEVVAARFFLYFGAVFDARGWSGPAAFCFRTSLRWRPSNPAVCRRAGLMLAAQGRHAPARVLLQRIGGIETMDDPEVLRALEAGFQAEKDNLSLLKCLRRRQVIEPGGRGIDARMLDLCVALERTGEAITLLESGRIEMTPPRIALLHELLLDEGRIGPALACADRLAATESAPYTQSVLLLRRAAERHPGHADILARLGRTLQKTSVAASMQEGAEILERVIAIDPARADIRAELAAWYRRTMQHASAIRHLEYVIEREGAKPEAFLELAEISGAEGATDREIEVLERLRAAYPDDYRPTLRLAELQFAAGRAALAETLLEAVAPEVPESESARIERLRVRLRRSREQEQLKDITRDLSSAGAGDHDKRLDTIGRLLSLHEEDRAISESDLLLESQPDLIERVRDLLIRTLSAGNGGFRLHDYLADLELRTGRFDEALAQFRTMAGLSISPDDALEEGLRKILARAPGHVAARLEMLEIHRRRRDWPAMQDLLRSMSGTDLSAEQRLRIRTENVEATFRAGEAVKAAELGVEILPDHEGDIGFILLLLDILDAAGEYHAAYDLHRDAQVRFPGNEGLESRSRRVVQNQRGLRLSELEAKSRAEGLSSDDHYELADLYRKYNRIQEAIPHYQHAAEEPRLTDVAVTKLAVCLCDRRLFDLADETLERIDLTREKISRWPELKNMFYWIADTLEQEKLNQAALKYFRRLFHVDASFRDVIARLEKLDGA